MHPLRLLHCSPKTGSISIFQQVRYSTNKDSQSKPAEKSSEEAVDERKTGKVYRPFPTFVKCEEGKKYLWCSCGYSKSQPFCDASHQKPENNTNLKPVLFECKETKKYLFCMCKQTKNRPFCDLSHVKPSTLSSYVAGFFAKSPTPKQ